MSLLAGWETTSVHPGDSEENDGASLTGAQPIPARPSRPGLLPQCANPGCHSGWFHLFRKRSTPVFENGWTCSPECTGARVRAALEREIDGRIAVPDGHRHRVPLGLLMLEQGWITREQLRSALAAQRTAGNGRLGEWLIRRGAADELNVTRALGIQWSCPVLAHDSSVPPAVAGVVPRLFLDAFGVLPLRIAADKLLYLGFEESLDPVLALAVERMTGLRVESGVIPSSVFRTFHERALHDEFPRLQLGEAVSASAAAHMMARAVERNQPAASRLVRVHDCLWLRMILPHHGIAPVEAIRDVICSIGKIAA